MKKAVIDTELLRSYIENNEVEVVVFNGINLKSLVLDNEEIWASIPTTLFMFELNDNGTYTVVGYDPSISGDVIIPEQHDGIAVTHIGASAFENCSTITSITVPETITHIGLKAFQTLNKSANINFDYAYWCLSNSQTTTYKSITAPVTSVSYALAQYGTYQWNKFYAPEIAIEHFEGDKVNCIIQNRNNNALVATVEWRSDADEYLSGLCTVPANSSFTRTIGYADSNVSSFTEFNISAYFSALPEALSNTINVQYEYESSDEETTTTAEDTTSMINTE